MESRTTASRRFYNAVGEYGATCATVPPVPCKLCKMNVRMPFDLCSELVMIDEPASTKF